MNIAEINTDAHVSLWKDIESFSYITRNDISCIYIIFLRNLHTDFHMTVIGHNLKLEILKLLKVTTGTPTQYIYVGKYHPEVSA